MEIIMGKNKLLIVYNICGISGKDNIQYYLASISAILDQSFQDYKLVVSACRNFDHQLKTLRKRFPTLDILHTPEVLPVNITFNNAVKMQVKKHGPFEGYLYMDSGCKFTDSFQLEEMYKVFKSGPNAMVSSRTSTDTGIGNWSGVEDDKLFEHGDVKIPVGKAINLHVQIFSHDLLREYGALMPDIFASYCTESTFSFLCAAIKKHWTVCKDVMISHIWSMDGASSGFNPHGVIAQTMDPWKHLFKSRRPMEEIIADPEGIESGFGYEEVCDVMIHDPSCFDANYFCKNSKLKDFIKENIFLSEDLFDYNKIETEIW